MLRRDPYSTHTSAVDALAAAGIAPPKEWTVVRQRFTTSAPESMLDRYVAAVLAGDADPAARAAALAEVAATPQTTATVNNAVKAAVLRRLREVYAPHAETNYCAVADLFDAAAARLVSATAAVDPDADPAVVVGADGKTRQAWADAALAAAELDRLIPTVQAAAELAGVDTTRRESLFALLVDAGGLHRRRAWEAFDHKGGRTGRWGALLAAGATIRACRPVTALVPYRQAAPIEERWERTDRGQHRRYVIDPEDVAETTAP